MWHLRFIGPLQGWLAPINMADARNDSSDELGDALELAEIEAAEVPGLGVDHARRPTEQPSRAHGAPFGRNAPPVKIALMGRE